MKKKAKIEKIWAWARRKGVKAGMRLEDAEDFAQRYCEQVVSGALKNRSPHHAIVDFFRESGHDTRTTKALSYVAYLHSLGLVDMKDGEKKHVDRLEHFDEIENLLKDQAAPVRAIFLLYHFYGYLHHEIAHMFGFSEARSCQIIKAVEKEIRVKIKTTPLRLLL